MAQKLYEESNIQDIADAIRTKNGSSTTYTTSEMAAAILALTGGAELDFGPHLTTYSGSYTPISNEIGIDVDIPGYWKSSFAAMLIWTTDTSNNAITYFVSIAKTSSGDLGAVAYKTASISPGFFTARIDDSVDRVNVFSTSDTTFAFNMNIEYKYLCILRA